MDNQLVEALLAIGFTKEDIENLPLSFKMSEMMANQDIKDANKRKFYPSEIHGTKRLPQNKFYKKISNLTNIVFEYE